MSCVFLLKGRDLTQSTTIKLQNTHLNANVTKVHLLEQKYIQIYFVHD